MAKKKRPALSQMKDTQVGDVALGEIHRQLCLLHARCEGLGSENEKIAQQLAPDYANRLDDIVAGLVKHNRRNCRLRSEILIRRARIANSLVDSGNVDLLTALRWPCIMDIEEYLKREVFAGDPYSGW